MTIEKSGKEIIIRISSNIGTSELKDLVNFIAYKETTGRSKAKQSDVNKLAAEVNRKWWMKNSKKFINETSR
jgi:hypothetical protein